MEFRYVQNIESDEPVMLINRHIGFDLLEGPGIDGAQFLEELMFLDTMDKKRIQVWINSSGGVVMDGYNICMAILKSKTPVDTYCLGMAASIAGVIFQTGRKRYMADYGILMYHNPYNSESDEQSPLLDSMKESLNTLIRTKSGMTPESVQTMMDRTSFIQSSEALSMNLCDQIEHTVKLNTKYFPRTTDDGKRFWEAANRVLNKLFDNQTAQYMKKVANKLNLNAEASEDAIVEAINTMEQRATDAEAAVNKGKTELEKLKSEMDDLKSKFADKCKEYDTAKKKLDDEEAEKNKIIADALAEKATVMVENAVRAGKIKNEADVIESWKAKAIADFDGINALLESISSNKAAVKIVIANKAQEDKLKYHDVSMDMVMIENRLKSKNNSSN